MKRYLLAVIGLVLLICLLMAIGTVSGSPDIVVHSTTDILDAAANCDLVDIADLPGPDAVTSLREAICAANNNPGSDTIAFNIPIADLNHSAGVWTIWLTASLPTLNGGGTIISGTTQAAFIGGDPNPYGPEIEIAGAALASGHCLQITSAENVIHGLVINRCPSFGIVIWGSSATTNTISGNYIGTDPSGSLDLGNDDGVYISGGAQNVIGGNTPGERNIISGNSYTGVHIAGSGADGNNVSGNYIGTDASGSSYLGNGYYGVDIIGGAQNNVIGGNTPGERNLISGNDIRGLRISGSGTMSNTVCGNYIGTDASGSLDLGNTYDGVYISGGAQNNTIGLDNIIAYNGSDGVEVQGTSATGNTITKNSIHSNGGLGIYLNGGNNNLAAPVLASANCTSVGGSTTIPFPTVEVFSDADGQGRFYEEGVVIWGPGGTSFGFLPDAGLLRGRMVTATATDSSGNTSQFSEPVHCGCPEIFLPLIMKNY